MKKLIFFVILLIVLSGIAYNYYVINPTKFDNIKIPFMNNQHSLTLKSPVFVDNANIPQKYTCDDENVSPPLTFSQIPVETRSLALIMDDPDAPSGNFTHWVIFDLNPSLSGIDENSLPDGAVEGENGAGESDYTGPCPPSGTHRYNFTLYALDSMLGLDRTTSKEALLEKMKGHILDQTTLTGKYQKK